MEKTNTAKVHETADVSDDAVLGNNVKVWNNAQIRENAVIGDNTIISKNVYIDFGVRIGENVKIQNNVSVYHGVMIQDGVFVGPHVCFTNDKNPRAINKNGSIKSNDDWEISEILIKKGASIGANATILPGITVGEFAIVGAGSVVTKDVPSHTIVIGNPAREYSKVCACGKKAVEKEGKFYCETCESPLEINDQESKEDVESDEIQNIPITKVIISDEEKKAVIEVLDSGMLIAGKQVKEFEEKFADYCGCEHAVAVNSGTAALHAALYALGIGPGDEVITTPFTFIATANPILMQGANVVFADIDPYTYNISPESIKEKITPRTKAIITVDLYGNMCDYDAIQDIAKKNNLYIVEDCAQAHGAEYDGKKAGTFGDVACFSFYPSKNMMTGEGGMLVTNNLRLAERAELFRNHGQTSLYEYEDLGYNYRMMNIQAAIGLEQLKKIDSMIEKRRENAQYYHDNLKNIPGIELPRFHKDVKHSYHQFTIRINKDEAGINRNDFSEKLTEAKIGARIYYPKPLHMHRHFIKQGYKEKDFPKSEKASEEVISIPVHPLLTNIEREYIVKTIKSILV
jgi:perosamine synthetase